ncbi:hypothetical protein B2J88_08490 [Rhodococcus sp. SRB_17]|nr:hypothetical protein [Rhodococcus sp. SRB_17]
MNKATKGAVAAGAAALLLAGGAGTMAAWSDSEAMTGGTITAGHLTLTAVGGAPTWSVTNAGVSGGAAQNIPAITSFRATPGDVLTYSGTVKIGFAGTNLKATLKADASTITGTGGLPDEVVTATAATVDGVALETGPTGVAITSAQDNKDVAVKVTFTFGKAGATNASQDGTINLANFNVTLDQA